MLALFVDHVLARIGSRSTLAEAAHSVQFSCPICDLLDKGGTKSLSQVSMSE